MDKKIALVTGGIGGIGTAICDRLSSQGYFPIANYYPDLKDAAVDWGSERPYQCGIIEGDVSDYGAMLWMTREIEEHFGKVLVLVNCAGITRDRTLMKMDDEDWNAVIDVNLTGMFNVTKRILPHMVDRRWGRIVNISSVNGQQGQFGQCNYSAAKAGVHGFTMALAREVATKGITVNTVSPGYIDTDMTKAIADDIREQIVGSIPMKRMGSPEDIAAAVGFLVRNDSSYITGTDLSVNGGLRIS